MSFYYQEPVLYHRKIDNYCEIPQDESCYLAKIGKIYGQHFKNVLKNIKNLKSRKDAKL